MATTTEMDNHDKARALRRRKIVRARRIKGAIGFILALAIIVGSYPLATRVFDHVMASDSEVTILSDVIAKIVPKSLLTRLTSGALSTIGEDAEEVVEEEEGSILNIEALEGAEITDPNVLAQTTPVSDAYLEESLLIGDSMYDMFETLEIFPVNNMITAADFTPESFLNASFEDTGTGLSGDIGNIVAARAPKRLYLAPGYAGISMDEREDYLNYWRELISLLRESSPETSLVIMSIPPIGANASTDDIANDKIRTLNGDLLAIARETNIHFLETFSNLTNELGTLSKDYDDTTGHLSESAYKRIMDILKNHAVPTS